MREDPDHAERDRDRGRGEHEREQEGERAEDVDQDQHRDRDRDEELADEQVVVLDGIEVVLDRRLSREVRRRPRDLARGLAHSRDVHLRVGGLELRHDRRRRDVVGDGARAGEPSGGQLRPRRAGPAARTFGSGARAWPGGVVTTSVNEPSGFWPKLFLRMSAAFSLSEPGSAKRFVSRSDRPAEAEPAATTATSQTASTAQRNRIIVRAQRATFPPVNTVSDVSAG